MSQRSIPLLRISLALSAALGDPTREPRIEIMRWLLEAGADPNVRDRHGDTPLIEAAELGRYEAVELLLEHDADMTLRTTHQRSASRSSDSAARIAATNCSRTPAGCAMRTTSTWPGR